MDVLVVDSGTNDRRALDSIIKTTIDALSAQVTTLNTTTAALTTEVRVISIQNKALADSMGTMVDLMRTVDLLDQQVPENTKQISLLRTDVTAIQRITPTEDVLQWVEQRYKERDHAWTFERLLTVAVGIAVFVSVVIDLWTRTH